MPQGVVDVAEVVEVDHQERKAAAVAPRHGRSGGHVVGHQAAVGQAGQRVGGGEFGQALVLRQACGEVAKGEDTALRATAVPQRARAALDDLARVQGQALGAHQQWCFAELIQTLAQRIGVDHAGGQPVPKRLRHTRFEHGIGHAPDLGQAAVAGLDLAARVKHQDALVCGLQRGLQLRQRGLALVAQASLCAQVAQAHQAVAAVGQEAYAAVYRDEPAIGHGQLKLRVQALDGR